ncbi:MAG: efflux transporter outer rane subunit [Gammaproteobacteria bacterium]|nr:efflux transporter outer rane subunit [Gammaproteobacteria bacterium]
MNRAGLGALPCSLLLCACTVGPNFKPPEATTAQTYAAPGDSPPPSAQHVMLGARIEGDWWAQFHSPALDQLIKLAIANNQDIVAAKARVAQAQEDVNAARGALLPSVSFGTTVGRQKYGAALFGPLNFTIPPFTYYTVGPSINAPLDLFGGSKRALEQKAAYNEYRTHELNAAYLSLTANVTAQALAAASARAQIGVIQGIIADDQRNVELVQTALDSGSATRTQLLSAQSQLATDRTLLPELHQQESTARHALAILVGKEPAEWTPPQITLDDFVLPGEIPASLPSQLVHRRPDILAAEAQLHAASAAIGVATANLYPNIDLSGSLTQQALTPGGLFNGVAVAWSMAANFTQPLYNGGRLKAQQRAAINGYQAALADYRQVVLRSFGDVADGLQALSNDEDQFTSQTTAAQTAAAARELARRSYSVGNSGILDVLDAERFTAQAQLGLSRAKAQRLLDSARLYMALGGTPLPMAEATASAAANATEANRP